MEGSFLYQFEEHFIGRSTPNERGNYASPYSFCPGCSALLKGGDAAKRCEFCEGRLSRVAHTDSQSQMYLICLDCGRRNRVGKILKEEQRWPQRRKQRPSASNGRRGAKSASGEPRVN